METQLILASPVSGTGPGTELVPRRGLLSEYTLVMSPHPKLRSPPIPIRGETWGTGHHFVGAPAPQGLPLLAWEGESRLQMPLPPTAALAGRGLEP